MASDTPLDLKDSMQCQAKSIDDVLLEACWQLYLLKLSNKGVAGVI